MLYIAIRPHDCWPNVISLMISKASWKQESLCTAGASVCNAGATPTEGLLLIRLYIQTEIHCRRDSGKHEDQGCETPRTMRKASFNVVLLQSGEVDLKYNFDWLTENDSTTAACARACGLTTVSRNIHLLRKYLELTSHLRHTHTHHSQTHIRTN